MSEKQSITYSTGLNPVAVDSAGNLVCDSAGNLVIPIEPILLFPSAGAPSGEGADPTGCQTITVTLPDQTETFRICDRDDRVVSDVGIVNSGSGLTLNMRTLQKKFGDTVTLSLAIQTHFKRKWNEVTDEEGNVIEYCSWFTPYSHGMSIEWGNKSINGNSTIVCGGSVHVGKVTIDFNSATVSLDTSAMPGSEAGAECGGCYPEPPVEIITVKCDSIWCNGSGSIRYLGEAWLWGAAENEVEVRSDQTLDDAIAESTNAIRISGIESKPYISIVGMEYIESYISGKKFFRNPEKDYKFGYKGKDVNPFVTAGRNVEYKDAEIIYADVPFYAGDYKDVKAYRTAKTDGGEWSDLDYIIYDEDNTLITDDALFGGNYAVTAAKKDGTIPDVDGAVIWYLNSACDESGNSETPHEGYGYLKWTGAKTDLPDWPGEVDEYQTYTTYYEYVTFDGKFTAWCTANYQQNNGYVAAFPGKPYWGKDEYGFDALLPPNHSVQGYHRRSLGIVQTPLEVNGKYYSMINYTDNRGQVAVKQLYKAWSLSPCHRDYTSDETYQTVFTAPDNDSEVYFKTADTMSLGAYVTETGSHKYVLETVSGNKWYWSEDLEITPTDEEFE